MVTSGLANMSISKQERGLPDILQDAFQAFNKPFEEKEVVLVISLGVSMIDCPGMLPEEKVCLIIVLPYFIIPYKFYIILYYAWKKPSHENIQSL